MYKQSIILFGIVVPLLIAAVILGACSFVRGKFTGSVEEKALHFSGHERNRMAVLESESRLSRQRADYKRWKELTSEDTFSLVTTNLREIGEALPPKEFQQTAFERLEKSSGLGSISGQKSSGLKFNFRGTFRSVQKALLELETRMPNLQLLDLKIDPNQAADFPLLNFQVTYTAWEN